MKRNIFILLIIASILIVFSTLTFASQTINVKDYIKDKFPSIFGFYLSSLEDLDSYEKEFIDLLEKLPGKEQEYYAKEVYKNSFSLELLKSIREGKTIQAPTSTPSLAKPKEKPIESLPSIIKRIEPSTVIIFTYDNRGEFLCQGSGFFISQNGDIITNYHLFRGAKSAEVKTPDGKIYSVPRIVAVDDQSDIIRVSIDIASPYVYPLPLCTTLPEVGERIIVYGSPLGLEKTVSDGIVSAVREVPDCGEVIQITAPVSPGSSGSPVLNMNGEVIGVATFQMVKGQNLNFAIPSEKIVNLKSKEEKTIVTSAELFWQDWQENKEKKDSDYAYEAFNKALYFIDKKEYEEALPYLEIAVKTDILLLKAWAHFRIGFCYEKLGAYYADAYSLLGTSYYIVLDLYKCAIDAYKQAIYIDPNYADAHSGLGTSYIALGLYKDAIEAFKQTIRIEPDSVGAHFGLGLMYLRIGDRNSALNEYKILKDLDINAANELFDSIY
jgi:hypothetical protein